MSKLLTSLVVGLLILVLAACGGGGASGSPTDAAKGFMEAIASLDEEAAKGYLCSAQAEAADEMTGSFDDAEGFTMDVSGLTYTAGEVSGNNATVTISGNIRMEMAGESNELPADTLFPELPMVNEGGSWKVCPSETGL